MLVSCSPCRDATAICSVLAPSIVTRLLSIATRPRYTRLLLAPEFDADVQIKPKESSNNPSLEEGSIEADMFSLKEDALGDLHAPIPEVKK
jgi:hypothetical protein